MRINSKTIRNKSNGATMHFGNTHNKNGNKPPTTANYRADRKKAWI